MRSRAKSGGFEIVTARPPVAPLSSGWDLIIGARAALNGYQKGHCFYCFAPIDGAWNLVLACPSCNGWQQKSERPPAAKCLERLHRRNEFLIASHHPLRPTLLSQTGPTATARIRMLQRAFSEATVGGARQPWLAPQELPAKF